MKRKADVSLKSQRPKKIARAPSRLVGDYQRGRELARTPKAELKAFDIAITTTAFSTIAGPPAPVTVNAMVNGAELFQRVGRKCYNKSLHFRGVIAASAAAVETQSLLRIIIYYDAQPNGLAPAIGGIIQDSSAGAATSYLSEINLFNRARFKILRDYQVFVGQTSANGSQLTINDAGTNSQNIDFFIKLRGLESVYNATNGGTVADITSGAIGFVCIGDANAANFSLTWHSRVRYYD